MILSRRVLLAGLVLAFIAMQTLGFVHRVVHGTAGGTGFATAVHHHGHDHAHEGHAHDGAALFAGHDDGSPDCRVYDQLSHTDVLGFACAALPVAVPPSFLLLLSQGDFVARWAALFDARGPPPVL